MRRFGCLEAFQEFNDNTVCGPPAAIRDSPLACVRGLPPSSGHQGNPIPGNFSPLSSQSTDWPNSLRMARDSGANEQVYRRSRQRVTTSAENEALVGFVSPWSIAIPANSLRAAFSYEEVVQGRESRSGASRLCSIYRIATPPKVFN